MGSTESLINGSVFRTSLILSAETEARGIVEEAEKEARELREQTQNEAQEIMEAARRQEEQETQQVMEKARSQVLETKNEILGISARTSQHWEEEDRIFPQPCSEPRLMPMKFNSGLTWMES